MTAKPHQLQNETWQVGILPETGSSIAYGRIRYRGTWLDILRPTPPEDYGKSSLCSSFIMMPWANRIAEGRFSFDNETYQLETSPEDGTARHGDVRDRAWHVYASNENFIHLTFDSADHEHVNFPFHFQAEADFRLDGDTLVIGVRLINADKRPFPAGFGHHPYFVRPEPIAQPQVMIPCNSYFPASNYIPTGAPLPVDDERDFRKLRPLTNREYDDLFTGCEADNSARIVYSDWGVELDLHADAIFRHWLLFTRAGKDFFALEPMTIANDGFNLYQRGIAGSGTTALAPGQAIDGTFRIQASVES